MLVSRSVAFAFAISLSFLFAFTHANAPSPFPLPPRRGPVVSSQTACDALRTSVPAALAKLPRSAQSAPLNITNVITKLYAYGDNPTTAQLFADIPASALGFMADVTLDQVASSTGDWDRYAMMFDQGYGLEDAVQVSQGGLPAFCRFGASIITTNTSTTWFETWMPVPSNGTNVTFALTAPSNSSSNYTKSALMQSSDGRLVRPTDTTNTTTVLVSNSTAPNSTNNIGGASRKVWQGRLVFLGSSAQRGAPSYPEMKQVLARYREATASSNLGHFGTGASTTWAVGQPEAQNDFGFRGTHLAALAAQHVVKLFYNVAKPSSQGKSAKRSTIDEVLHQLAPRSRKQREDEPYAPTQGFPVYYKGCSTGGRQAMVEAQRFPFDFDGIIAGSPAIFYNELNAYQIHVNHFQANRTSPSYIPRALYKAIHDFVLRECDALDGLTDAVIQDPTICKPRFDMLLCDPASLPSSAAADIFPALLRRMMHRRQTARNTTQNSSPSGTASDMSSSTGSATNITTGPSYAPAGSCLTAPQITNLRNIYTDYKYPNGTMIHEAVLYGSENVWPVTDGVVGTAFPPAPGWYQYQVLNVSGTPASFPYYSVVDNNFTLIELGHTLNPGQTESDNPNMSKFFTRGGKLLHYHGLSDQLIPPGASDRFHDMIRASTNASPDSYRYFHVPGMGHCRGGDGPWNFGGAGQTDDGSRPLKFTTNYDFLLAMFDWVENGNAPKMQFGANYKIQTGPQQRNASTIDTDVQQFSNGVKVSYRICPYPKTLVFADNSTTNASCQ